MVSSLKDRDRPSVWGDFGKCMPIEKFLSESLTKHETTVYYITIAELIEVT